jgi:YHS domain-containing protein
MSGQIDVYTPLCPTCGCSLVRLGIPRSKAVSYIHDGTELFFCCLSCLHEFVRDPQRFLDEVAQIFVCPVCLAEKPRHQGVTKIVESLHITFCRCSHCYYTFLENPEYYVSRLKADYGEGPTTWVATCC